MINQQFEQLVVYLQNLIADGVQLVHGGNLLDWSDTKILDLLDDIKKKKEDVENLTFEVGDLLENRLTGQKSAIISIDKDNIHLLPVDNVVIFPKDNIWYHYRKSKPGE